MAHIHEMQFVEIGGVRCNHLGCGWQYSEDEIIAILDRLANERQPTTGAVDGLSVLSCAECGEQTSMNHKESCSKRRH